jgi:aminoglycoside/choline kinase family phosphotransferase
MREQDSESWTRGAIEKRFPRGTLHNLTALKGDASTRRFWRVGIAPEDSGGAPDATPSSAIVIALGPDDLPLYARALQLLREPLAEPPWLNVHRFLSQIGAPVPVLYLADVSARMLLVEDVGKRPLFEAAQQADAADLYRLAVEVLLQLHLDGTKRLDENCLAAHIAYDERLFRWELDQFAEAADQISPGIDRAALRPDLDELAARLGRFPRVFSHRDYHGHNLFVQSGDDGNPRIRIIDFQDALMGPAAQDLAVLLTTRDTARIITDRVEQRVLDYYYAALLRKGAVSMTSADFLESYRLCVLQHALKVIGRFTYLERTGKTGYSQYIPFALAQASRMLARDTAFPALRTALLS